MVDTHSCAVVMCAYLRDRLVGNVFAYLILGTRCGLDSKPSIDRFRFVVGGSPVMGYLTVTPSANIETENTK